MTRAAALSYMSLKSTGGLTSGFNVLTAACPHRMFFVEKDGFRARDNLQARRMVTTMACVYDLVSIATLEEIIISASLVYYSTKTSLAYSKALHVLGGDASSIGPFLYHSYSVSD